MTSIFISHSRKDKDILDTFNSLFAGTTLKAIRAEFESFPLPPWKKIKEWVQESSAVFLLLGPNLKSSDFTQNWVSYEVGLACAMNMPVWVFEKFDEPLNFPVPYLNHYLLYDPSQKQDLDYIKARIEEYNPSPQLAAAGLLSALGYAVGGGGGAIVGGIIGLLSQQKKSTKRIICPYPNCKIEFNLHGAVNNLNCPSCRQGMKLNN